ncbi:hypothetical protein [Streptomyces sp. SAJ15]|uniref:hypothetical protein n=1 Tax=Streptomyces sp. SAJ15 TaxID=2011095 RepID=UPI0011857A9D|nr:hypothetical protein [Streptomyces sp. SAJ15]TVL90277.1 hypothetical protein CD790_22465 [Streptomyces sp. SAJ15]
MTSAKDDDAKFLDRAERQQLVGGLLLTIAAGLWLWFAWLLAVPYEVDDNKCEALLFAEPRWESCEEARPWWEMLAILGVSVPVAIVGTALCVAGHTNVAISRHWRSAASLEAEAGKDKSAQED